MNSTLSKFLKIAGVCGILAPLLMLVSDLFVFATGMAFEWTIGMWLASLLFIPAVIGFTYILAASGSRLAYAGGILAFFGVGASASMQVLFRVHAVLNEQGSTQVVEQLRGTFKLIASTQMIGLTWPIGLILLAISQILVDRSKWLTSLLLAAGAIAFPIGRIAGLRSAAVISGVLFIAAFSLIARQMFSWKEQST